LAVGGDLRFGGHGVSPGLRIEKSLEKTDFRGGWERKLRVLFLGGWRLFLVFVTGFFARRRLKGKMSPEAPKAP
jgi:hypothetical protein